MISMLAAHLVPELEFDDHDTVDAGYALANGQRFLVARIDGGGRALRVTRLSPSGLVLAGDGADRLIPGEVVPLTLHLGGRRVGPLGAYVAGQERRGPDGAPVVQVRFPDIRIDEARAVLGLLTELAERRAVERRPGRIAVVEAVSEPDRLPTVARALVSYRCEGFARGADGVTTRVRGAALGGSDDPYPLR